MMIPVGLYFLAFIIYELCLRGEASKYNRCYKDLTYITFKWAGPVLVNIFLLKAGKISSKMKMINVFFVLTHIALITSAIFYTLYVK